MAKENFNYESFLAKLEAENKKIDEQMKSSCCCKCGTKEDLNFEVSIDQNTTYCYDCSELLSLGGEHKDFKAIQSQQKIFQDEEEELHAGI